MQTQLRRARTYHSIKCKMKTKKNENEIALKQSMAKVCNLLACAQTKLPEFFNKKFRLSLRAG